MTYTLDFSTGLGIQDILLQSVYTYLVNTQDVIQFQLDVYRNRIRQCNHTLKRKVTYHAKSYASRHFTQKKHHHVISLIKFHRHTFYEDDNKWLFLHTKRLPQDILCHSLKYRLLLKQRFIQLYSTYQTFLRTKHLCASHKIDVDLTIGAFTRAQQNHKISWLKFFGSPKSVYGYNIYDDSHRSNVRRALYTIIQKQKKIILELHTLTRCCSFPKCTQCFTLLPKYSHVSSSQALCVHHQHYKDLFTQCIRPSTNQLLQLTHTR